MLTMTIKMDTHFDFSLSPLSFMYEGSKLSSTRLSKEKIHSIEITFRNQDSLVFVVIMVIVIVAIGQYTLRAPW